MTVAPESRTIEPPVNVVAETSGRMANTARKAKIGTIVLGVMGHHLLIV